MSSIPDVLLDAANVIEARGWHQGGYVPGTSVNDYDPDTCPVCVLGAINVAADYLPDIDLQVDEAAERYEAALALANHLGLAAELEAHEGDVVGVVGDRWNDNVATSAEQVTTALRECAASLKAGA